jgi:hypothetical protein
MQYLGFIALVMVLGTMARWFYRAWRVNVPSTPYLFQALAAIGLVVGMTSVYIDAGSTAGGWAIGLSVLFLYLTSTGAQRVDDAMVAVGDTLPNFTAPDENGNVFDSTRLAGSRVLLKFFRGHW